MTGVGTPIIALPSFSGQNANRFGLTAYPMFFWLRSPIMPAIGLSPMSISRDIVTEAPLSPS